MIHRKDFAEQLITCVVFVAIIALVSILFGCAHARPQFGPETEISTDSDTATVILMSPMAHDELEDIVRNSYETKREQAGCVIQYGFHKKAQHMEITLSRIIRANIYFTTDTSVQSVDGIHMCPVNAIGLHTHIKNNGALTRPSLLDTQSAYDSWRLNPFDILISIYSDRTYLLTVYAWRK